MYLGGLVWKHPPPVVPSSKGLSIQFVIYDFYPDLSDFKFWHQCLFHNCICFTISYCIMGLNRQ